jgi:DNA-binding CsgD family transcriptional regulator
MSACRNFYDLARLLTLEPLTDYRFDGCIIALVENDGRIRELGRFGMMGPGPSKSPVEIGDQGLVAKAVRGGVPRLEADLMDKAKQNLMTPMSDIDEIVLINEFQSALMIPLIDNFYPFGVVGLATRTNIPANPILNVSHEVLQALTVMTIRNIIGLNPPKRDARSDWLPMLNKSQREVLAQLGLDRTNKEIADSLSISLGTVKLRVSELLRILDAGNRKEAAVIARQSGIA